MRGSALQVVVDGIEVPSNATIGSVLATRLSAALPLVSFALTNNIKSCTRLGPLRASLTRYPNIFAHAP
jgi:hypothetical protein